MFIVFVLDGLLLVHSLKRSFIIFRLSIADLDVEQDEQSEFHPNASRRIHIPSLPRQTTVEQMTELFGGFGEIIVSILMIMIGPYAYIS